MPFPQGFRMVVGGAKRQVATPKGAPGQFWCAGAGGEVGHPSSGSAAGFALSSGNASSMHGDAFLAWDDAALGHRVKDCLVQKAKSNTDGTF